MHECRRMIALLLTTTPVFAQDGEMPQLDFLEYLGSWQAEDEEWFVEVEIESLADEDSKSKDQKQAEQDNDKD